MKKMTKSFPHDMHVPHKQFRVPHMLLAESLAA